MIGGDDYFPMDEDAFSGPSNDGPGPMRFDAPPVDRPAKNTAYERAPLPNGTYRAKIVQARFVKKDKGPFPNHWGLEVKYEINFGPHKGKWLWNTYMFEKPKHPDQKDYRWVFSKHIIDVHFPTFKGGADFDPNWLLDKRCQLTHEQRVGTKYGNVKAVFPDIDAVDEKFMEADFDDGRPF